MSRYEVDKFLRRMITDEIALSSFKNDPRLFLQEPDLTEQERAALIALDFPTLYHLGAHPFLLNGFMGQVRPDDRGAFQADYRKKIAAFGYPDFST